MSGPDPQSPPVEASRVEHDLAVYYDQEADDRADRPLDDRRIAARTAFLHRLGGAGVRVLEVGPGAGRDSAALVAAGHDVVGVDLSRQQLRHAVATGSLAIVSTARSLPFPDDTFEALWTMSVLMHVPDTAIVDTLVELRRVLRPGALAAIGVWGGPDVEDRGDRQDRYDPPRLFSRRSDHRWQALLGRLGEVVEWENWHPENGDFWYQWAVVRVPSA